MLGKGWLREHTVPIGPPTAPDIVRGVSLHDVLTAALGMAEALEATGCADASPLLPRLLPD